jgi:GTP-binding protein
MKKAAGIRSATFVKSSAKVEQLPSPELPEFAFIGRSNVGKSSLINMLVGQKELAHTSSNPGKTQTINHYLIDKNWYLVDLPGYGYAKVARSMRTEWQKTLEKYILTRENLMNVFVLVDSRIPPQESDLTFINRLGERGIPLSVVFTKCDKIGKVVLEDNIGKFREAMLQFWEETPPFFITSAEKGTGKDELLTYVAGALKNSDHGD